MNIIKGYIKLNRMYTATRRHCMARHSMVTTENNLKLGTTLRITRIVDRRHVGKVVEFLFLQLPDKELKDTPFNRPNICYFGINRIQLQINKKKKARGH